ncbi:hypothetical protein CEXT_782341 [Caerostris extrusa]|uniref:Uncharacterized protein n=1 Tax=Caerostris extrusa TaxID=172846 RepID=A0AAV4MG79_CAEEX|nr:hypothetical protein CEXT_782341 [Caerostris extrusa]
METEFPRSHPLCWHRYVKQKLRGCVSSSFEWCVVRCNVCRGGEKKSLEALFAKRGRNSGDRLEVENACFDDKWNLLFTKSSLEG